MKPLSTMGRRKLTPNVTLNTLESMIEYTLISSILDKICEITKKKRWNIHEMILYQTPSGIFSKLKHGELGMKRVIDKINEWAAW